MATHMQMSSNFVYAKFGWDILSININMAHSCSRVVGTLKVAYTHPISGITTSICVSDNYSQHYRVAQCEHLNPH